MTILQQLLMNWYDIFEIFKVPLIKKDTCLNIFILQTRVAGIGPAKAHSLVDSGIHTIEQLRDPANQVCKINRF